MSKFTDLLQNFTAEKHYLVQVSPYDPGSSSVVSFYYSSHGFTSRPTDTPANQFYEPRIDHGGFEFQRALFSQGKLSGRSTPGNGQIVLDNSDGGLDGFANYAWSGRAVTIWLGSTGFELSDFGVIYDGYIDDIEFSDSTITVSLRDKLKTFDVEIQPNLFSGYAAPNGDAQLNGRKKPLCYGIVRNIEPIYMGVIGGKHTFAVGQVGIETITVVLTVRDNGAPLTFVPEGTTPAAGQWTSNIGAATIILGGSFTGRITADVVGKGFATTLSFSTVTIGTGLKSFGINTVDGQPYPGFAPGVFLRIWGDISLNQYMEGQIYSYSGTTMVVNVTSVSGAGASYSFWQIMPYTPAHRILYQMATQKKSWDIDEAAFAALDAVMPYAAGYWVPDGGNMLEIMDAVCEGSGIYYGFNRNGQLTVGRITPPATPVATYTSDLEILQGYPQRLPTQDPNYRTIVYYQRNWTPMTGEQIAASVSDSDRKFLTSEWRQVVYETASVQTAYPQSVPLEVFSIFDVALDADAEASRLHAMFSVRRDYFKARVKIQPLQRELGDTVAVQHSRYGLSGGKALRVVDATEDFEAYEVELGLWG